MFTTTNNYSSMLSKIALFNFLSGIILLHILSIYIQQINNFLNIIKWDINFFNNSFNIMAIGIPFIITVISRIIKLHDRISDIFGIRKKYDIKYILLPFTKRINLSNGNIKDFLEKHREFLMKKCFYDYASSQENQCQIEYHNVIMALEQFSWYWVLIEVMTLTSISILISLTYNNFLLALILFVVTFILFLLSIIALKYCKHYTKLEVTEILDDPEKVNNIKNVFYALQNK